MIIYHRGTEISELFVFLKAMSFFLCVLCVLCASVVNQNV